MIPKQAYRILSGFLTALLTFTSVPSTVMSAQETSISVSANETEEDTSQPEQTDEETTPAEPATEETSAEESASEESGAETPSESATPPQQNVSDNSTLSENKTKQTLSPLAGSGDITIKSNSPDKKTSVGMTLEIDRTSLPGTMLTGDISIEWYRYGNSSPIRTISASADRETLSTVLNTVDSSYTTQLEDSGKNLHLEITCVDNTLPVLKCISNTLTPVFELNGNAKAGGILTGSKDYHITDYALYYYKWYRYDMITGVKTEVKADSLTLDKGNDLSKFAYYLRDEDIGTKISFAFSKDNGAVYYETEPSDEITASDFTEIFNWKELDSELSIGKNISKTLLDCRLEKFSTVYNPANVSVNYTLKLMSSADSTTETENDDKVLYTHSETAASLQNLPDFLLPQDTLGKHLYFRLESSNEQFRRPLYKTDITGPVVDTRFPLSAPITIGSFVHSNNIPKDCYSTGSYTYKIMRISAEAGAVPETIESGRNNTPSLTGKYIISEKDIGYYFYIEVSDSNDVLYYSEKTSRIKPRNSLTLSSSNQAGDLIYILNKNDEVNLSPGLNVSFEFYTSADKTAEKGIIVKLYSQFLNSADDLSKLISYTLQPSDIGQFLHLKLIIGTEEHKASYHLVSESVIVGGDYQFTLNKDGAAEQFLIGDTLSINSSLLPAVAEPVSFLRIGWHRAGCENPLRESPLAATDPAAFNWENILASPDLSNYTSYRADLPDGGSAVYAVITFYDNNKKILSHFVSNKPVPVIPLSETAAAGSPILVKQDFTPSSSVMTKYKWYRINDETGMRTELSSAEVYLASGQKLPALKYYPKDSDTGSKIYISFSIGGGRWIDSLLTGEVKASVYKESFDWKAADLNLMTGDRVTTGLINCGLENFTNQPGNSSDSRDYKISLISSLDNSIDTEDDDIVLKSFSEQGSSLSSALSYTLTLKDRERYLYFRLEGKDFRKPIYVTGLSAPIQEKKFMLNKSSQKIGTYLSTSDIPSECYSQGSYTYNIIRTPADGSQPQIIAGSTAGNGSTLSDYIITDADINCSLSLEITAKDGTKFHSEQSQKIAPRNLYLTGGNTAGDTVSIAPGGFDDHYLRQETVINYEYNLSDDPAGIRGTVISKGTVTAQNDNLYSLIPSYSLKDEDAGKYLHLKMLFTVNKRSYTYLLKLGAEIEKRNILIEGIPSEGQKINLTANGSLPHTSQSRYEWLIKTNASAGNNGLNAVIAASGRTTADEEGNIALPAYSLRASDTGKYLYLRITDGDKSWYSKNAVGPVTACQLITGKVSITGKAASYSTLAADWEGQSNEDGFSFQWFHAGNNIPIGTGPQYTIKEEDCGKQIYVSAIGNGIKYRGTLSSSRTKTIISKYSPEYTGIKAINASLESGILGFDSRGERESVKIQATLQGIRALPAGFQFSIWINNVESAIESVTTIEDSSGQESMTSIIQVKGNSIRGGTNTITVKIAENGNAIQDLTANLLAEAYDDISLTILNKTFSGKLLSGKNKSTKLTVIPDCDAVLSYDVGSEQSSVTISESGELQSGSLPVITLVTVTAVSKENPKRRGVLTIPFEVTETENTANRVAITCKSDNAGEHVKQALEELTSGFDTDPSKTGEENPSSLQLSLEILPEGSTSAGAIAWTSSDPSAAVVDSNGLVTALSPGREVTITAAMDGLSDSVTFTTRKTKYTPDSILYSSRKLTLQEQSYLGLTNIKVKYNVIGGSTSRTFLLDNSSYTYTSNNRTVVNIDDKGNLFGMSPGEAYVTIRLKGSSIMQTVAVTVKEKQYSKFHFTLDGHFIETTADSKGVLRGDALLYEDELPVPLQTLPLQNAMAFISSDKYGDISREIALSNTILKINKKYPANKAVKYSFTLPNKQKLVLNVTVANTQPQYLSSGTLYKGLDVEAPVTFSVYPGTRIYSVSLKETSNLEITSWSQNANTVTVWVRGGGAIKSGRQTSSFLFDTAGFADGKPIPKTVSVNLTVTGIPNANIAPVYITGGAFSQNGYLLKNLSELMKDKDKYYYDTETGNEWQEVIDKFTTGYYTVYPDQNLLTSVSSYSGLFEIKNGRLLLKKGKDASDIPAGNAVFTLKYYYMSEGSSLKTEEKEAKVKLSFHGMSITQDAMTFRVNPGRANASDNTLTFSLPFKLYSNYDSSFGINKNDLKKYAYPTMDQRYQMKQGDTYTLYWTETGKPVEGVTITPDGAVNKSSIYGQYRNLTFSIASGSELIKNISGPKTYPGGSFEIHMTGQGISAEQVKVDFTPVLTIQTDSPIITPPGKIRAFNQKAFNQQSLSIAYKTDSPDYEPYSIEAVLTDAPQMEDPFTFKANPEEIIVKGNYFTIAADGSKTDKIPLSGIYTYSCSLKDWQNMASSIFTLSITVSKDIGDIQFKAKISGNLNPYYSNPVTGEGTVKITITSNIPNLDIAVTDMKLLETPKKSAGTVLTAADLVDMNIINVSGYGSDTITLQQSKDYQFDPQNNYIPADIAVNAGGHYTAVFKQLKPVSVKAAVKSRIYTDALWDLSGGKASSSINLINAQEHKISIAAPIDPLEKLEKGSTLYKKTSGGFLPVSSSDVAVISSIKLSKASQASLHILDYDPDNAFVLLNASDNTILKPGKKKITYEIIPKSSSSNVKQRVLDIYGNELYTMKEDFNGSEKYDPAYVEIPKPVTMQQTISFYYSKIKNPSLS